MARRRPRKPPTSPTGVPPIPADLMDSAVSAETYTAACRRYGLRPQARYRMTRTDKDAAELAALRRRAIETDWYRLHT